MLYLLFVVFLHPEDAETETEVKRERELEKVRVRERMKDGGERTYSHLTDGYGQHAGIHGWTCVRSQTLTQGR